MSKPWSESGFDVTVVSNLELILRDEHQTLAAAKAEPVVEKPLDVPENSEAALEDVVPSIPSAEV